MANKARYYGIGTKRALDNRSTASPNFVIKDELTESMVNGAIAALATVNPGFDNLSAQMATQEIKKLLKERGFRGELNVGGAKISDTKGNSYAITHANNANGEIVIGDEKHNKLDEQKKK